MQRWLFAMLGQRLGEAWLLWLGLVSAFKAQHVRALHETELAALRAELQRQQRERAVGLLCRVACRVATGQCARAWLKWLATAESLGTCRYR